MQELKFHNLIILQVKKMMKEYLDINKCLKKLDRIHHNYLDLNN
jgi:hypothetical protein